MSNVEPKYLTYISIGTLVDVIALLVEEPMALGALAGVAAEEVLTLLFWPTFRYVAGAFIYICNTIDISVNDNAIRNVLNL